MLKPKHEQRQVKQLNNINHLKLLNDFALEYPGVVKEFSKSELDNQEEILLRNFECVGLERKTARAMGLFRLVEDRELRRLRGEGLNPKDASKEFRSGNAGAAFSFADKFKELLRAKKEKKMLLAESEYMEKFHQLREEFPDMPVLSLVEKMKRENSGMEESIRTVQRWRRRG